METTVFRGINNLNDGPDGHWWSENKGHAEMYASESFFFNGRSDELGQVVTGTIDLSSVVVAKFEVDEDYEGCAESQDLALLEWLENRPEVDVVVLPGWEAGGHESYYIQYPSVVNISHIEDVEGF